MYSGRPIIPVENVAKDFFGLTTEKFVRKVSAGDIALPLVRMEASQKCAKGVHINDLAEYLDKRRAAAVKECQQLRAWVDPRCTTSLGRIRALSPQARKIVKWNPLQCCWHLVQGEC
jgi:hypothetical protein